MTTVRELTNRHRAQQLLLRKDTQDKVAKLWPILDWAALDESYAALSAPVATLVRDNRRNSAGLASLYLKQARRAAGVKGAQRVILAGLLPDDQFDASLAATSIAALKTSASNGVKAEVALANALTQTQGSMSRLVLMAGRDTITQTAVTDRTIQGWVRVGVGECDWCQQYLDGEIRTVAYDFPAHDNCRCSAEVAF